MCLGDVLHRVQQGHIAVREPVAHAPAARALAQIIFRAVLAGEEAHGEREIGNDAEAFLRAEVFQIAFILVAGDEVEMGLQHAVARQAICLSGFQGVRQLIGIIVRRPDEADFARLDEFLMRLQRLLNGRVLVGRVGEIEINMIGLEPLQRRFAILDDELCRETIVPAAHIHAGLGDEEHIVPFAGSRQPVADDRL